jgi:hypothetical protein
VAGELGAVSTTAGHAQPAGSAQRGATGAAANATVARSRRGWERAAEIRAAGKLALMRVKHLFFTMRPLPANDDIKFIKMLKAILTDVQFWIPVGVLAVGVAMLAWLH